MEAWTPIGSLSSELNALFAEEFALVEWLEQNPSADRGERDSILGMLIANGQRIDNKIRQDSEAVIAESDGHIRW